MKSRGEKIGILKGLLKGEMSLDEIKRPTDYDQLTINEKYLLLTIYRNKKEKECAECIEYYRQESIRRQKVADKSLLDTTEIVKDWYRKLSLPIQWKIK